MKTRAKFGAEGALMDRARSREALVACESYANRDHIEHDGDNWGNLSIAEFKGYGTSASCKRTMSRTT